MAPKVIPFFHYGATQHRVIFRVVTESFVASAQAQAGASGAGVPVNIGNLQEAGQGAGLMSGMGPLDQLALLQARAQAMSNVRGDFPGLQGAGAAGSIFRAQAGHNPHVGFMHAALRTKISFWCSEYIDAPVNSHHRALQEFWSCEGICNMTRVAWLTGPNTPCPQYIASRCIHFGS